MTDADTGESTVAGPNTRSPTDRAAADRAVADLLSLLGRRHTLSLLYLFTRERRAWRFTELQSRLSLSPTTLSERLTDLTDAGLVERRTFDDHPPRVEYHPTERLLELRPVFGALYRWAGSEAC